MTYLHADPLTTYAVVVGVEKYDLGLNWHLNGPVNDALRFTTWLRSRGVPDGNISLFLSPLHENTSLVTNFGLAAQPATRDKIYNEITSTLRVREGSLLWIFWGGHGVMSEGTRRLFYENTDDFNLLNLDLESLLVALRSEDFSGFKQQVCIIDACANFFEEWQWQVKRNMPKESFPHSAPLESCNQFLLLAAQAGGLAKNVNSQMTGLFTKELLNQLQQEPCNVWPPNMDAMANHLETKFTSLRNQGATDQKPDFFKYQPWPRMGFSFGELASRIQDSASPTYLPPNRDENERAYLEGLLILKEDAEQLGEKYFSLPTRSDIQYPLSEMLPSKLVPQRLTVLQKYFPKREDDFQQLVVSQRDSFDSIEEALEVFGQFILVGEPGSGKTTVLWKLIFDKATQALEDVSKPIPVFISLKEWPDGTNNISDLITEELKPHHLDHVPFNRLLIVFDGLDEISADVRQKRSTKLSDWLSNRYRVPVIISCRANYQILNNLPKRSRVVLKELDNNLIYSFLHANLVHAKADVVIRTLQPDPEHSSPRDLIRLARNPFFLRMLTEVYNASGYIPRSQGRLFHAFVEQLYTREEIRHTTGNITLTDILNDLGSVAVAMYKLRVPFKKVDVKWAAKYCTTTTQTPDELWRVAREMTVLQLGNTNINQFISFFHGLLAAYFAGMKLVQSLDELSHLLDRPKFADGKRSASDWDDVVKMSAGIAPANTILPIVASIDPFLAVECLPYLIENDEPTLDTIDIVIEHMAQYLGSRNLDKRLAAESVLKGFPNQYQAQVFTYMKKVLSTGHPAQCRSALEVTRSYADRTHVIKVLADVLNKGDKWLRREASEAIVEIGDEAIDVLHQLYKRSQLHEVRKTIVQIFSQIPSQESTKYILDALSDSHRGVVEEASQCLAFLDQDETGAVIEHVQHRRRVVLERLSSPNRNTRIDAVTTLGTVGMVDDVPYLLNMLDETDESIVGVVAEALGELGGSQAIEPLIKVLSNFPEVPTRLQASPRVRAARALGLLKGQAASESLQRALNQENHFVRSQAAESLGRLRSIDAVQALSKSTVEDINYFVQLKAAFALGLIGDSGAIPAITSLLDHKMEKARGYAVLALGCMRQPSVVGYLISALEDKDDYVQQSAAEGLGVLRYDSACEALHVKLLKSSSHYVRQKAALGLGAIASPLRSCLRTIPVRMLNVLSGGASGESRQGRSCFRYAAPHARNPC
ncbi:MAG: HEAT repeat domain-containing protein, partial [Chloroflexota bacterium]|nr:HEAT repeat domain-containing protein [Chloroflexota bacterium]